jgi:hypothetical protein
MAGDADCRAALDVLALRGGGVGRETGCSTGRTEAAAGCCCGALKP